MWNEWFEGLILFFKLIPYEEYYKERYDKQGVPMEIRWVSTFKKELLWNAIKEGSSHSNWSYCLRFSDVMWPLLVLLLFIPSYDASVQILSKGRKSLDLINPCISYMLSIIHFTPYSTGPVPLTLISNTQQPLADVLQNRCL